MSYGSQGVGTGGHLLGEMLAKQAAVKLDPKAASNDLTFPSDKTLSQMHQNDPTMFTNPDYNKKWLAVQGQ